MEEFATDPFLFFINNNAHMFSGCPSEEDGKIIELSDVGCDAQVFPGSQSITYDINYPNIADQRLSDNGASSFREKSWNTLDNRQESSRKKTHRNSFANNSTEKLEETACKKRRWSTRNQCTQDDHLKKYFSQISKTMECETPEFHDSYANRAKRDNADYVRQSLRKVGRDNLSENSSSNSEDTMQFHGNIPAYETLQSNLYREPQNYASRRVDSLSNLSTTVMYVKYPDGEFVAPRRGVHEGYLPDRMRSCNVGSDWYPDEEYRRNTRGSKIPRKISRHEQNEAETNFEAKINPRHDTVESTTSVGLVRNKVTSRINTTVLKESSKVFNVEARSLRHGWNSTITKEATIFTPSDLENCSTEVLQSTSMEAASTFNMANDSSATYLTEDTCPGSDRDTSRSRDRVPGRDEEKRAQGCETRRGFVKKMFSQGKNDKCYSTKYYMRMRGVSENERQERSRRNSPCRNVSTSLTDREVRSEFERPKRKSISLKRKINSHSKVESPKMSMKDVDSPATSVSENKRISGIPWTNSRLPIRTGKHVKTKMPSTIYCRVKPKTETVPLPSEHLLEESDSETKRKNERSRTKPRVKDNLGSTSTAQPQSASVMTMPKEQPLEGKKTRSDIRYDIDSARRTEDSFVNDALRPVNSRVLHNENFVEIMRVPRNQRELNDGETSEDDGTVREQRSEDHSKSELWSNKLEEAYAKGRTVGLKVLNMAKAVREQRRKDFQKFEGRHSKRNQRQPSEETLPSRDNVTMERMMDSDELQYLPKRVPPANYSQNIYSHKANANWNSTGRNNCAERGNKIGNLRF